MTDKKKTVGAYAYELLNKEGSVESVVDMQRAMQKEYITELYKCVDEAKTLFKSDFFVTVLTKRVGYATNVIRNYFRGRLSCPTPEFDQAVYRYHTADDALEFIWQVPDSDTCELLKANESLLPTSEKQLLMFVKMFESGALLAKAQELNKEKELYDRQSKS